MSKQKHRRQTALHPSVGSLFAQPPKDLYGKTSVYLCGRELEVENFRELLDYREDRIRIRLVHGILTIEGDRLVIAALEKHRIRLHGTVLRTEFSFEPTTEHTQNGGAVR